MPDENGKVISILRAWFPEYKDYIRQFITTVVEGLDACEKLEID